MGRGGHGSFARVRFLRPLLDPRSVAGALFHALHSRPARALANWHNKLSLVRRHGPDRNDPNQGNLYHSSQLRSAGRSNYLAGFILYHNFTATVKKTGDSRRYATLIYRSVFGCHGCRFFHVLAPDAVRAACCKCRHTDLGSPSEGSDFCF